MRIRIGLILLAALASCAYRAAATGPQFETACAQPDSSDALLAYAQRLATDSGLSTTRTTYHLVAVPLDRVRRIFDEQVCRRAAEAYSIAAGEDQAAASRRRMRVVQVGEMYMVEDVVTPIMAGEWETTLILDNGFRSVASFGS